MTGAYKMVSTNALQVIAGVLPLDIEIQMTVEKQNLKLNKIDIEE